MKKTFLLSALLLCTITSFITSCSDENEHSSKYNSTPPTFNDLTIKEISTNSTTLHTGEKLVATMQQAKIGKLLYKAKYEWAINPETEGNSQKYKTVVIYDQEPQNPTDTLIINTPGTYTLTFKGTYDASAHTTLWRESGADQSSSFWPDNSGKVTYSSRGEFGFTVVATKKITVQ